MIDAFMVEDRAFVRAGLVVVASGPVAALAILDDQPLVREEGCLYVDAVWLAGLLPQHADAIEAAVMEIAA